MFHAKNDKETIATWRSDLNRILHVFNVRSVTPIRTPLTAYFQTELAINTNVAVSDIRHGVVDTHAVVSDTHLIVSDIHRTMVESREGADGKNLSVFPAPDGSDVSYLRPAYSESHLPHYRGLVSDARI